MIHHIACYDMGLVKTGQCLMFRDEFKAFSPARAINLAKERLWMMLYDHYGNDEHSIETTMNRCEFHCEGVTGCGPKDNQQYIREE